MSLRLGDIACALNNAREISDFFAGIEHAGQLREYVQQRSNAELGQLLTAVRNLEGTCRAISVAEFDLAGSVVPNKKGGRRL